MNILSASTRLNLSQIDRLFWKLGDKIKKEKEKEKEEKRKSKSVA